MTAQQIGLLLGQWPECMRTGARAGLQQCKQLIEVYPPLSFLASKGRILKIELFCRRSTNFSLLFLLFTISNFHFDHLG